MVYMYKCQAHGQFERREPMMQEHAASCPDCHGPTVRVYSLAGWVWENPRPLFHSDGSYEQKY